MYICRYIYIYVYMWPKKQLFCTLATINHHKSLYTASLVPRPLPLLQAGGGPVTFAIKTVASCCRKKCSTNQIAVFVRVTKRHVVSCDALWVYYSRVCDQAGDQRNTRGLFYSCRQKRGIAERLSKQSGVEVSYKHVLIHDYLHR